MFHFLQSRTYNPLRIMIVGTVVLVIGAGLGIESLDFVISARSAGIAPTAKGTIQSASACRFYSIPRTQLNSFSALWFNAALYTRLGALAAILGGIGYLRRST